MLRLRQNSGFHFSLIRWFFYDLENDEAHSSLYHLIAADITNIAQMEDKLLKAGLNLR